MVETEIEYQRHHNSEGCPPHSNKQCDVLRARLRIRVVHGSLWSENSGTTYGVERSVLQNCSRGSRRNSALGFDQRE